MKYSENALAIYKKLYFNRGKNNELLEIVPEQCHGRISQAISENDIQRVEFLDILNKGLFRPNSPVLINAGGPKQFLSACYVLGLEDSMDSIIDCWGTCAKIYASGAGAGIPLTNLRKKNGPITFGGQASGPLAYTKVLDVYSETVKAGNKARRAANMGMIKYNHPDVFELIDCKLDRVTLKNFNLSVSVTNEFMEKIDDCLEYGNNFDVITYDPKEGTNENDKIDGYSLWFKIIENCWKIGDPGLFFVDTVNKYNSFPKTNPIECTNPCGEVPLWPWSECVIGSINVSNFFDGIAWAGTDKPFFKQDKFRRTIDTSFRFLDNCISRTMHPHPNFKETMNRYRPIGLGIMGLADLFVKLEIPYDSIEAIKFFETLCFELNKQCIITSIDICKNGATPIVIPEEDKDHFRELLKYYLKMDGHILNDYDKYGIRNCTWTCIAPTGSISISADCSYSFEPLTAIVWQKELAETHKLMNFINPEFDRWLEIVYDRKLSKNKIIEMIIENNGSVQGIEEIPKKIQNIFKVAHDIDPYKKIDMQAAGQKWISLAISSTCNLPESAIEKDISDIYLYAWKQGLKGITVYRDKSQEWQPMNFGKKDCKEEGGYFVHPDFKEHMLNIATNNVSIVLPKQNEKIERPVRRKGETFEINTPHGRLYCTFNKDEKKRPLEVFLRLGKSGTLENLLLDTISRLISKNLQNGVPYKDIVSLLRGIKEEKFWFKFLNDVDKSDAAESIIDAVGIIMDEAFDEDIIKAVDIKQEGGYPIPEDIAIGLEKMVKKSNLEECPECHQFQLTRSTGCKGGYCLNCNFTNCG